MFTLPSGLFYRFPGLKRMLSSSSTLTTALPPCVFIIGPLLAAMWGSVVAPGNISCQQSWRLPPQALFWEPPVTHYVAAPVTHWTGLVCISALHRALSNRRNKLQDTAHSQQSKAPTPFFTCNVLFCSLGFPRRKVFLQNNVFHSFRMIRLEDNSFNPSPSTHFCI